LNDKAGGLSTTAPVTGAGLGTGFVVAEPSGAEPPPPPPQALSKTMAPSNSPDRVNENSLDDMNIPKFVDEVLREKRVDKKTFKLKNQSQHKKTPISHEIGAKVFNLL
jgi:hypothetical protein